MTTRINSLKYMLMTFVGRRSVGSLSRRLAKHAKNDIRFKIPPIDELVIQREVFLVG